MCSSLVPGHLESVVCELSDLVTVESYFRCAVRKTICHDESASYLVA